MKKTTSGLTKFFFLFLCMIIIASCSNNSDQSSQKNEMRNLQTDSVVKMQVSTITKSDSFNVNTKIENKEDEYIKGRNFFKMNCISCHRFGNVLIGPDLTGVMGRWQGREKLLKEYIRNPSAVIAKDGYAKALHLSMDGVKVPAMEVTDSEMKSLLTFLRDYRGIVE